MAAIKQPKEVWHEKLVCHVQRLEYDFESRIGKLFFPPSECCDMKGALELFKSFAPQVRRIETFAGDEPDTVYKLVQEDDGNSAWYGLELDDWAREDVVSGKALVSDFF